MSEGEIVGIVKRDDLSTEEFRQNTGWVLFVTQIPDYDTKMTFITIYYITQSDTLIK